MNPKILSAIRHYLAGLIASSWNGGIGAVAGILGIDAVAMSGATQTHVLNWHEMLAAFGGAFVLHAIMWLKSHPLPEDYDTTAPFFPAPKDPPPQPPSLPSS